MNKEQEQMIKEESFNQFEITYGTRISLRPFRTHFAQGYFQGRLKSMEEIEKLKWQMSLGIKANDNQIVMIETLESKLPDQYKLREATEDFKSLAQDFFLVGLTESGKNRVRTIKTFLESLGEK